MFKLKENGTSVKTELVAGVTTFLTMVYIIIVNPTILSAAGVPSQLPHCDCTGYGFKRFLHVFSCSSIKW